MWPGFLLLEVGQDVALGSCAFKRSVTHRRWEKVHPANDSHVGSARTFYTPNCVSHLYLLLVFLFIYFILSSSFLSHKQTCTQLQTHTSSSTFHLWVSYPQVFYYSDAEHYEPFSMHENREIYPWKWDTLRIWELNLTRIRVLYVRKRRHAYLRTKAHVHAFSYVKWRGIH